MSRTRALPERYDPVSTANGAFAMLAIDQRESLRVMLRTASDARVPDEALRQFKVQVASALSGQASGILVDPLYGLHAIVDSGGLAPGCGLIVSVDNIDYDEHGTALTTGLVPDFQSRDWAADGAVALKFLLIWSESGWFGMTPETVQVFLEHCRSVGLLSFLEVVVREPDGLKPTSPHRQAELLVVAAGQLAAMGPDLYKTEVPFLNRADEVEVVSAAAEISRQLECPWVVLSSGVNPESFPAGVERACQGGASGFLAGRAIWGPAIGPNVAYELRHFSVNRLKELRAIAEAAALERSSPTSHS